ncbi:MAG: amidohydrolase family protein [Anaerolineales bacterium]|nr:amidohydrolase family protein [Anaerolineales bacterium]
MSDLLIKNVRPHGREPVDVLIQNGRIAKLEANIVAKHSDEIIDGENQLLLPGLVNAHAHIDKNFIGLPWQPNQVPGSRIKDYVDNERHMRRELNLSSETQSARDIETEIATGTTHIRTHVDLDTEFGIEHFEGVLATKEKYKGLMTLQTVAFPHSGMLIRPGTIELLEEAVKLGADCIGGLDPSTVDRDPAKHLDIVFDIADRYGVEVDIHLHEPGRLGAFSVELIAERTRALGLQGKVTISHVFCLGQVEAGYLNQLIDLLLENQITIMSLGSGTAQFPPLKLLHDAGVPLCTGTDGVRDAWGPYNSTDLLNRVKMLGYRTGLRKDHDVEMLLRIATYGGAAVMKESNYGLEVGHQADLFVVAGDTPTEAVMVQPPRKVVVKNGRVVARNGKFIGLPT